MNSNILKNLKLLIVEDEKNLASHLKSALNEYFHSIVTANDGIEGIRKLKSSKPDIVITDIMMPNCDGLDMTMKIKDIDEDLPVIILSAHSHKEKLLKAIDLGINKYFIKPFDPEELIEHLIKIAPSLNKKKKVKLKDGFVFDNNSNSLYKEDKLISLTKREKEFIYLLLRYQNEVVDQKRIKLALWEEDNISDERLRTFVKRLRIKTSKELIENASGQGYLISPLYT